MPSTRSKSKKYRARSASGADRAREQMLLWSAVPVGKRRLQAGGQEGHEDTLGRLLREDLDFEGKDTSYSRHNFHAFAAKFPPQLPAFFIQHLTVEGEVVLDPMVGSGTAVLEAQLLGRNAIGFDIDPLAYRVSLIKTMRLDAAEVADAASGVIRAAQKALAEPDALDRRLSSALVPETLAFIDYWFLASTRRELFALSSAISRVENARVRTFLEVAFSSIIVTKSGGVSLARDLAHTRPHKVAAKAPKNALDQFAARVRKSIMSLADVLPMDSVLICRADARSMPLEDNTVDLIVTSPPYANAIDYMRAHKFSLVWLGDPIKGLSELRSTYIGTEKTGGEALHAYGPVSEGVLAELSQRDEKKRRVMSRYLRDMMGVFSEMRRVLKPGRCAVVVVGSSTMRGLDVRTHDCLAEVALSLGWRIVGMAPRRIARDKRMMPMRRAKSASSQIEQRMSQEFVIGMVKP